MGVRTRKLGNRFRVTVGHKLTKKPVVASAYPDMSATADLVKKYGLESGKVTKKTLKAMGEIIVEEVRNAAVKDALRTRAMTNKAKLPEGKKFLDSIYYFINSRDQLELRINWPNIASYMQGQRPFKMTWLTQQRGVYVVPMTNDRGELVFRRTPAKVRDAWIHPGMAKHTFINVGVEKAMDRIADEFALIAVASVFG